MTAETVRKVREQTGQAPNRKHKIRYVFDGIRYVPDDISLQTAAHCGSLTTHCGPLQDCCGGKVQNTVDRRALWVMRARLPRRSPFVGATRRVSIRPRGLFLWLPGSHYDVDGKETNGCELRHPDLTDLGTQSC